MRDDLILNQDRYPSDRGTFGPLGNIRKNGCGSIALYNILRILHYPDSYKDVLFHMQRHWMTSMIFGGMLGSNPLYLLVRLWRRKELRMSFYQIHGTGKVQKIPKHHGAYLNLYFYRCGSHYTASCFENGRLQVYNDSSADTYSEYYRKVEALCMLVIGIDRADLENQKDGAGLAARQMGER